MTNDGRKINGDEAQGYVVLRPRPTDAIGMTLRNAFERELRLPDDIAVVLQRMDRVTS